MSTTFRTLGLAACVHLAQPATILDLSRNLNLTCIVEGVETMEQVRILQDTGCMFMQGFHFSHPVAEADVAAFLDAERARVAA